MSDEQLEWTRYEASGAQLAAAAKTSEEEGLAQEGLESPQARGTSGASDGPDENARRQRERRLRIRKHVAPAHHTSSIQLYPVVA